MTPALAEAAAREADHRIAAYRRAAGNRRISPERARERENIWLAIACHAGADRPEFAVRCIAPPGQIVRAAWYDFASEAQIRAELARARDVALDRAEAAPGDLRLLQRYWEIAALADEWLAPGYDFTRRQRRAA